MQLVAAGLTVPSIIDRGFSNTELDSSNPVSFQGANHYINCN